MVRNQPNSRQSNTNLAQMANLSLDRVTKPSSECRMTSDPFTYDIEDVLWRLQNFRARAAVAFTNAAEMVAEATPVGKASPRRLRALWSVMHDRRVEYDCACRAVEAIEKHDRDSYLFDQVAHFMAEAERMRRDIRRSKEDERTDLADMLRAILAELRELRDKVAPPQLERLMTA